MKTICLLVVYLFFTMESIAQDVAGKWYGKLFQEKGGYSELYSFELNLSQRKKNIYGESYAYIPTELSVRIGLNGRLDQDSIRLTEYQENIREDKVPDPWELCIKNYILKYSKDGGVEFLKGTWNGKSRTDSSECVPGNIILSKSKTAIDSFFAARRRDDSISSISPEPVPEFTQTFRNTTVKTVSDLQVKNRVVALVLDDYHKVDDDTVSIFFNRKTILEKARISKKKIYLNIILDSRLEYNEILLFAENLGTIPPNTSQLIIIDGTNTHRLIIEADMQKSASVHLKYKP